MHSKTQNSTVISQCFCFAIQHIEITLVLTSNSNYERFAPFWYWWVCGKLIVIKGASQSASLLSGSTPTLIRSLKLIDDWLANHN